MKKVFLSIISFSILSIGNIKAQYELYPSIFGRQTINGGTARYMAIGGAATALGADLGAAYVNPAGLGMYRKSEIAFTPNFGFSGTNSTFLNESEQNNKGSFGISNIGVALCGNKDDLDQSAWRGGTFSIGMTKTNNFHNRISFTGVDDKNSMADFFVEQANGNSADYYDNFSDPDVDGIQDLGGLAYYSYLIEPYGNNISQYYHGMTDETVQKEAIYTTKGSQTQWNLAYGANYQDKIYIGGGLGITGINFKEDLNYTETVGYNVGGEFKPIADTVNYFTFNDYNTLKGTGLNFKLGYIFKPVEAIRLGTTITTPTHYWMTQQYSSDLTVQYADDYLYYGNALGLQEQSTNPGYFKFNYTSPLKLASGLAFFVGKSGFLSADVEYLPYQFSNLSGRNNADDKYLKEYNKAITNSYKNVLNLRLGGELRMDIFKLRAGLAYLPNPYSYADNVNRDIAQISGGFGVRLDDMYFDLGISNSRFGSSYNVYSLSGNETTSGATSKNSTTNVAFTLGFYFE